jgi:phosphohistidine phosphatase SixA
MPVKSAVNKSDEVRKLHASGVKSASEIVNRLGARGIKVAPSQVYQVLAQLNKRGKKKGKRKFTRHVSNSNETMIDTAVLFVKQAGGMSKARELLSKLALLHD